MSDQGFRAIFDNGLMKKEPAVQDKIASELARRNMDLGPFVLYADFAVKSHLFLCSLSHHDARIVPTLRIFSDCS